MFSRFISYIKVVMLVLIPLALVMALRECHDQCREAARTEGNQNILLHNGEVEIGRTQSGRPRASVSAITLKTSDLKRSPDSLLAVNRKELKIKNSRIMAAATTSTTTRVDVKTAILPAPQDTCSRPLSDSYRPPDAPQTVSWSDSWVTLRGRIEGDSMQVHIESRDTLQMVVHRIPKKFLFFRYGTKGVRMDVVSQNPHTQLSYPKIILLDK
nr:MAG TPA: hypothetical protein [Caudoviricetes sp.]